MTTKVMSIILDMLVEALLLKTIKFFYLMKKRIAHAMNLLIETQIPVQEIAVMSGFNNKTHFYKTFRKYIGVKPAFIRTYKQDSASFVHSAINKSINAFYEYDAENSPEE